MEEMYVLHELHGDDFNEVEQEVEQEIEHDTDLKTEQVAETEEYHQPTPEVPWQEPLSEEAPEPRHNLQFVPIEEPGPNWEMELAQAYVRAQPLEGVFPPEEGLRMGTIFPNLSQPYGGRE